MEISFVIFDGKIYKFNYLLVILTSHPSVLIRYQRANQTAKTRNEQSLGFQNNEQIFDIVAYLCRNIGVRFRPEPRRLIIAKRAAANDDKEKHKGFPPSTISCRSLRLSLYRGRRIKDRRKRRNENRENGWYKWSKRVTRWWRRARDGDGEKRKLEGKRNRKGRVCHVYEASIPRRHRYTPRYSVRL